MATVAIKTVLYPINNCLIKRVLRLKPYFLVSFGPCANEQLMSNNRAQTEISFWVLIPNTKAFLPSVSVAAPHRLTGVFPATTGTTTDAEPLRISKLQREMRVIAG